MMVRQAAFLNISPLSDAAQRVADQCALHASSLAEPAPAAPTAQMALAGLIGRPLAEIERMVIEASLAQSGGSVPKAARMLELSPSTLYRKIEAWGKA